MDKIQKGAIIPIIIILAVIIFFFDFYIQLSNSIENMNQNRLTEIAESNANSVNIKLNTEISFLETLAAQLAEMDSISAEETVDFLSSKAQETSYVRIAIDLPDGTGFTSDNKTVNVKDMVYFPKVMAGETVITDIVKTKIENVGGFGIAVPIIKNGEVIGGLRGIYLTNSLKNSMSIRTFDGKGYFYIIDRNGNFLINSNNAILKDNNLINGLKSAKFTDGDSLVQFRDRMNSGLSGFVHYSIRGNPRLAYYIPMETNDWYLMTVVPESFITNQNIEIGRAALILVSKLILLFIILSLLTFFINKKVRKRIEMVNNDLEQKTFELETVSENINGGILSTKIDDEFTIQYANIGFMKLLGYGQEEVIGSSILQFLIEEEDWNFLHDLNAKLNGNSNISYELRGRKKDGTELWLSIHGKQVDKVDDTKLIIWILVDIDEVKKADQQLKISEERYRIAVQNTRDIIVDFNCKEKTMFHATQAMERYGVPQMIGNVPDSLITSDLIHKDNVEEFLEIFQKVQQGQPVAHCTVKAKTVYGDYVWNKLTFNTIFDRNHKPIRAVGVLEDITTQKEAELQKKIGEQYRDALTSDAISYYEVDFTLHRFLKGHEKWLEILKYKNTNDYIEVMDMFANYVVFKEDREAFLHCFSLTNVLAAYATGAKDLKLEYRREIDFGRTCWVLCTMYLLKDELSGNIKGLLYIKDINEAKEKEILLQHNAERDLLTGLYNKVTTENMIKHFLKSEKSKESSSALMIIDLDNFKNLNDTLGHAFGDAVLSEISVKLNNLFRKHDIIGRIGGDEFALLLKNVNSVEIVMDKAEKICDAFRISYSNNNKMCSISGTVGVAIIPQHGTEFSVLYEKADQALYKAKHRGKDTCCVYQ